MPDDNTFAKNQVIRIFAGNLKKRLSGQSGHQKRNDYCHRTFCAGLLI
jgi:hypothetical protein